MEKKDRRRAELLCFALLLTAAIHFVFIAFSGKSLFSPNPYNSYARQAAAWLTGHLELPENYEWLELAVYRQKYYVSFPPFPSYLLLPFAFFFGTDTPDSLIAFAVLLTGTGYAVKIACRCGLKERYCVLFPVFLYCGSNLWQITVDGWVWFFAQSLAFTLTLMAFYYALAGKKGKALFFLCAAVGCRPFQLLYLPLVLGLLLQKEEKASWAEKCRACFLSKCYRFLPAAFLALSYLILNFLRFGNPLEFGHNYLPEFTRSAQGQFSLSYLGENLPKLFRLPCWEEGKLIFPQFDGSNLFLVYPIFLLYLFALLQKGVPHFATPPQKTACGPYGMASISRQKDAKPHSFPTFTGALPFLRCPSFRAAVSTLLTLLLLLAHLLLLAMHKTMGGSHFGNRYIADLVPAVYLLLVRSLPTGFYAASPCEGPERLSAAELLFYLCFFFGLLLNFAGVLEYYR